jgi:hypothetical protein
MLDYAIDILQFQDSRLFRRKTLIIRVLQIAFKKILRLASRFKFPSAIIYLQLSRTTCGINTIVLPEVAPSQSSRTNAGLLVRFNFNSR